MYWEDREGQGRMCRIRSLRDNLEQDCVRIYSSVRTLAFILIEMKKQLTYFNKIMLAAS